MSLDKLNLVKQCQERVEKNREDHEAWKKLGDAYFDTKKLQQAIHAYKEAIKIKPDYHGAFNNLGYVYQANNQLELAISAYLGAIKVKPDYHGAFNNLGLAYQANNQLDLAISAYLSAIKIKPDYHEAFNNLGLAYKANNQFELTISAYLSAIKIKPDYSQAFYNLGNAYCKNNQFEQGLECYNTALKLQPFDPLYMINKALTLYEMKKQGEAFELFNQLTLSVDMNDEKTKLRLKKEYKLHDCNIRYIANRIKQFNELKKILKEEVVFTSGTQIADKTTKIIFQSLKNVSEQDEDIKKQQQSYQKLQAQINELQKQLKQQIKQSKKNEQEINQLKEYSGQNTSKKFDKLVQNQTKQRRDYFIQLVYRLTITIKSYQYLQTGMFQTGDGPIQSKTAAVASFLQKGLSLAEKIPLVESLASMIKGVCEFYIGMEGQFVCQAIVSKFKGVEEKDINIQAKKMALSLAESPNFEKLFKKEGKEILWFQKVAMYYGKTYKKLNGLKEEGLAKITDMANEKISEDQNLAREHCVEILTTLIMQKNKARIEVSAEQFLSEAAKIFLEQNNQPKDKILPQPQPSPQPLLKKKRCIGCCCGEKSECTLM